MRPGGRRRELGTGGIGRRLEKKGMTRTRWGSVSPAPRG